MAQPSSGSLATEAWAFTKHNGVYTTTATNAAAAAALHFR